MSDRNTPLCISESESSFSLCSDSDIRDGSAMPSEYKKEFENILTDIAMKAFINRKMDLHIEKEIYGYEYDVGGFPVRYVDFSAMNRRYRMEAVEMVGWNGTVYRWSEIDGSGNKTSEGTYGLRRDIVNSFIENAVWNDMVENSSYSKICKKDGDYIVEGIDSVMAEEIKIAIEDIRAESSKYTDKALVSASRL